MIIAPGVDNAMFYFNSDVLKFGNDEFANINVITQIGSIFGQQVFRFFLKDVGFKTILTISTFLFSLNSSLKLVIIFNLVNPLYFTYVTSWLYTFINAIHLMPIMVLSCKMCP